MSDLLARFTIPALPPRATEHWATIYKAKEKWELVFRSQSRVQKVEPSPQERRIVIVELFRPGQDMDIDNLHARMKVPLDVLSRAHGRKKIGLGVIWDDAPRYLDLHPFCVRSQITQTVVTVLREGADVELYRAASVQLALS